MEIGLDVEDTLENSQNELLSLDNNQKDEILTAKKELDAYFINSLFILVVNIFS